MIVEHRHRRVLVGVPDARAVPSRRGSLPGGCSGQFREQGGEVGASEEFVPVPSHRRRASNLAVGVAEPHLGRWRHDMLDHGRSIPDLPQHPTFGQLRQQRCLDVGQSEQRLREPTSVRPLTFSARSEPPWWG